MSLIMIAVVFCLAALAIVAGGMWYAWQDYNRHPDRYGYRPGERERRFTTPERGVTREAAHQWRPSNSYTSAESRARPML
jgi:hypothetical protein